jgi:hypothetical protein
MWRDAPFDVLGELPAFSAQLVESEQVDMPYRVEFDGFTSIERLWPAVKLALNVCGDFRGGRLKGARSPLGSRKARFSLSSDPRGVIRAELSYHLPLKPVEKAERVLRGRSRRVVITI